MTLQCKNPTRSTKRLITTVYRLQQGKLKTAHHELLKNSKMVSDALEGKSKSFFRMWHSSFCTYNYTHTFLVSRPAI